MILFVLYPHMPIFSKHFKKNTVVEIKGATNRKCRITKKLKKLVADSEICDITLLQ
jgi:hypothetical protein